MALAKLRIDKVKFTLLLAEREMKIHEVAKVAGVSATTVYNMVNGQDISPAIVGKLARALSVGVEDIIIKEEQR